MSPTTDWNPVSHDNRWLLAIESSTSFGGVALLREGAVVDAIDLEEGLRHGRDLLPTASRLLEKAGLAPARLWGVAVSAGPGSYTGVRVGVMAAKAFAYATGCKLAAVSSLAALADSAAQANSSKTGTVVVAVQDARRDEVYAGLYQLESNGVVIPLREDAAVAPEEAAELYRQVKDKYPGCLATGSGFFTYAGLFPGLGGTAVKDRPRASAVGRLGWRQLLQENYADPFALQPLYLRRDPEADWAHDRLIP